VDDAGLPVVTFYPQASIASQLAGQTIPGNLTVGGTLVAAGNVQASFGSVDVSLPGQGLKVKEGSNCKQGTFVLAGTATTVVPNSAVTATSRIQLTPQALGTVIVPSALSVTNQAGVSFTVTPSAPTDTSTVNFEIFEPG
jgi:hypothetical protein